MKDSDVSAGLSGQRGTVMERDFDNIEEFEEVTRMIDQFLRTRMGGQQSDRDNVRQELFVRLVVAMENGEEVRQPIAFLIGIAHWAIADFHRRRARNSKEVSPDDLPSISADGREFSQSDDRIDAIRDAIKQLSEEQRSVMDLTYNEFLSPEEVANKLGMKESTVRHRLHDGRARIRQIMNVTYRRRGPQ